jgi:uncharacterized protein
VKLSAAAIACCIGLAGCGSRSGSGIDPGLASEIDRIKAIDNHAHPARDANDHDFDALPVEMMQPAPSPARLDPKNPIYKISGKANTPAGVLDEAGIEIMLANRTVMGPGFDPARFKWVPYADALMYPLPNDGLAKRDPDRRTFFAAEEKLLQRYLSEAELSDKPKTLDDYLAFVTKVLDQQRRQGAVAEKFEMAYLRTLSVGNPQKTEAASVYTSTSTPSEGDYKLLQDYIFRYIASECGRLGMAVHIHTCAGAGGYFDIAGGNPMLLEPLFDDPALRKTQFVMVHGGWPWTREAQALLVKANAWADFSLLGLLLPPRALSQVLRGWLEYMPDKVLFGTDSGPFDPTVAFEQTAVAASRSAREALGMALTAMMNDGEITRDRAQELARMSLRDNARRLYGWK